MPLFSRQPRPSAHVPNPENPAPEVVFEGLLEEGEKLVLIIPEEQEGDLPRLEIKAERQGDNLKITWSIGGTVIKEEILTPGGLSKIGRNHHERLEANTFISREHAYIVWHEGGKVVVVNRGKNRTQAYKESEREPIQRTIIKPGEMGKILLKTEGIVLGNMIRLILPAHREQGNPYVEIEATRIGTSSWEVRIDEVNRDGVRIHINTFILHPGKFLRVGRNHQTNISVQTVSRDHLILGVTQESQLEIKDTSRNGTLVAEVR